MAIDMLSKVTLDITASPSENKGKQITKATIAEFIYGIGAEGLTPFEYEIASKAKGDRVELQMRKEEISQTFKHLMVSLCPIIDALECDIIDLKITIKNIEASTQRDIVSAIANQTKCGGGCDCGCGHTE